MKDLDKIVVNKINKINLTSEDILVLTIPESFSNSQVQNFVINLKKVCAISNPIICLPEGSNLTVQTKQQLIDKLKNL